MRAFTAVESALHVPYENIERVSDDVCLFLADVKHMDPAVHRTYTGVTNERILDNIRRLASDSSRQILLRVPLIPGVNDGRRTCCVPPSLQKRCRAARAVWSF